MYRLVLWFITFFFSDRRRNLRNCSRPKTVVRLCIHRATLFLFHRGPIIRHDGPRTARGLFQKTVCFRFFSFSFPCTRPCRLRRFNTIIFILSHCLDDRARAETARHGTRAQNVYTVPDTSSFVPVLLVPTTRIRSVQAIAMGHRLSRSKKKKKKKELR